MSLFLSLRYLVVVDWINARVISCMVSCDNSRTGMIAHFNSNSLRISKHYKECADKFLKISK